MHDTAPTIRIRGEVLRSYREDAQLTVEELASILNCSPAYLYGYENGNKVGQSVTLMARWMSVIGADANRVFGMDHIQPDYSGLSLDHRLTMYVLAQVFRAMDREPEAKQQLVESMLRAGDDTFLLLVRELLDTMLEPEQEQDTLLE